MNKIGQYDDASGDSYHPCKVCLLGEISVVFSVEAEVEIFPEIGAWTIVITQPIIDISIPIGEWHWSNITGFSWNEGCSNIAHKVTFRISKNEDGKTTPLEGATVSFGGKGYLTNELGQVVLYGKDGLHTYTVSGGGAGSTSESFVVSGHTRDIYHTAYIGEGSSSWSSGIKETTIATTATTRKTTTTTTRVSRTKEEEVTLESNQIGDNVYYVLYNSGYMMIYDSGEMYDYNNTPFRNRTKITSVSIENSPAARQISDLFNYGITSTCYANGYALSTVEVTGGECISPYAFYEMDMLKKVILPETITNIGYYAFCKCTSLENIYIYNRECNIYDSESTLSEQTVIYGYWESTAHDYADKYNRVFIPLDSEVTTTTTTTSSSSETTTVSVTSTTVKTTITTTMISTTTETTTESVVITTTTSTDITDITTETTIGATSEKDTSSTTTETSPVTELQTGDADADGMIIIQDATCVLLYYARQSAGLEVMFDTTPEEHEAIMACADIDGDGAITIKDATCILLYYARNSAGLPCDWNDIIAG